MKKIQLTAFLMLLSLRVHATLFQAMPLEKLVGESNAAAEVELKSKRSFMNKMGLIFTEYVFSPGESYNLENGDLDGEFLKITMTGGTVNGVTSFIDGAPEFSVGEKSFLLLKKVDSKIYLSNFTMGKYKIENRDGQTYYVSTVFPYDTEIGQVKKEKMIEMIKTKFKQTRVPEGDPLFPGAPSVAPDKKVAETKKVEFKKRTPAQSDERDEGDGFVALWAFFSLMVMSAGTIWWKFKKGTRV